MAVVAALALSSCNNNKEQMKDSPAAGTPRAIIHTNYGDMTVEFWPDVAPRTVDNFLKLSREKFYDGSAFHRIIKGFMIQGGCPQGTGTGGLCLIEVYLPALLVPLTFGIYTPWYVASVGRFFSNNSIATGADGQPLAPPIFNFGFDDGGPGG